MALYEFKQYDIIDTCGYGDMIPRSSILWSKPITGTCVCGHAQLLEPWNRLDFLFHIDFPLFIDFYSNF